MSPESAQPKQHYAIEIPQIETAFLIPVFKTFRDVHGKNVILSLTHTAIFAGTANIGITFFDTKNGISMAISPGTQLNYVQADHGIRVTVNTDGNSAQIKYGLITDFPVEEDL